MDNEVMELIENLYTMVSEAWGVPLGNDKCIIEREKALEILDEIKTAMPVELAEAKRLVSARDEFISNAKREAESVRKLAEEKARSMVEEQEVIRIAKARANEMVASAQAKSEQLRRMAGKYADDLLRNTEESISSAASQIHNQRDAFRRVAGGLVQNSTETADTARGPRFETISSDELN